MININLYHLPLHKEANSKINQYTYINYITKRRSLADSILYKNALMIIYFVAKSTTYSKATNKCKERRKVIWFTTPYSAIMSKETWERYF